MDKIACLFPFSENTLLLLKYKELLADYSLKYTGGLPGQVNGFIEEIGKYGIEYLDVWSDSVCDKFDIIIVPANYTDTKKEDVKNRLLHLQNLGKKVIWIRDSNAYSSVEFPEIMPISACIILIAGIGPHVQENEVAVELYKRFNASGIKTEFVSSYGNAEMMGFHTFPEFMFFSDIDEKQKMVKFNHYIKNIESTNPDVIIICVPDRIIPYPDAENVAYYGTMHFMISSVIPPDYVCCNLYAKEYSVYELDDIIEMCERRVGKKLDGVFLSDFAIDWVAYNDVLRENEIQVFPLSSNIVDKYVDCCKANYRETMIYSMRSIDTIYKDIIRHFQADTRNFQIL